jgi:hypothetical protein
MHSQNQEKYQNENHLKILTSIEMAEMQLQMTVFVHPINRKNAQQN